MEARIIRVLYRLVFRRLLDRWVRKNPEVFDIMEIAYLDNILGQIK